MSLTYPVTVITDFLWITDFQNEGQLETDF